jgi:HEAT repeat protein
MAIAPEQVREALQSEDYGDRLRAVNQIRDLDPTVGFELIQIAAADSNARVRYAAISQFSTLGHQDLAKAESLLRSSLKTDPEPDVQAAAADAISALKLTSAYEDMAEVYANTNEWLVKFTIVSTLGELGDTRAFELLQEALHSDNELVATAAVGALGELQDDRALPILLNYIEHHDWQVRHRLTQALSYFEQPEARSALEKLTQDKSPIVAEAAAQYLAQ